MNCHRVDLVVAYLANNQRIMGSNPATTIGRKNNVNFKQVNATKTIMPRDCDACEANVFLRQTFNVINQFKQASVSN